MKYTKVLTVSLFITSIFLFPAHFTSSIKEAAPRFAPVINNAEAAAPASPIYLTIPHAQVSTNIIDVGITPKGNLDVPGNYTEVGWYKFGTRPGQIGSAVIDGHVDNGGSIPGPFKHLRDLLVGDDIYVAMSDGSTLHYVVKASEVYDLAKFPGEQVFHETGEKYLKIITCHGKFVPKLGTYNQRLIVSAVLVS